MASRIRTVSRTVITRAPGDIDPKVAGVFGIAAATIAIVAAAVTVTVLLGGRVDLVAVAGPVLPVLLGSAVAYLRRSAHAELVEDGVHLAAAIATQLAPVLEHATPAIAAPVAQADDALEQLDAALAASATTPTA